MNYILFIIDMETIAFIFAHLLGYALLAFAWHIDLKKFEDIERRHSSYDKEEVEDLINNVINGR